MSRIKIVSDGSSKRTNIFDENGEPIRGVTSIDIHLDARGESYAVIIVENI